MTRTGRRDGDDAKGRCKSGGQNIDDRKGRAVGNKVKELPKVLAVPPCGPDCRVCHGDRSDRVSADRLWHWSLAHPGLRPLKE